VPIRSGLVNPKALTIFSDRQSEPRRNITIRSTIIRDTTAPNRGKPWDKGLLCISKPD
jgi:hypothetical protein